MYDRSSIPQTKAPQNTLYERSSIPRAKTPQNILYERSSIARAKTPQNTLYERPSIPRYLRMWGKGDLLHYVTSCHMTLSYHFTKPIAENAQLWGKNLLSNKLSRINKAKLISFVTENENLIKQPSDATSSSDSNPDFSSSPRSQTYGLRPFRGSISRILISPPTSI
ncbi:hypothetical protein AVEN_175574-1 [Araneus ventricosus]|uniref:Uncharacterized protein n=1 Tax=Araneus ventricosus TaxID=182803 RepID=A0A4Y2I5A6_ARAVE|nr:hypothetical protein AVEN_175574-1 [Araneus ventricosus]